MTLSTPSASLISIPSITSINLQSSCSLPLRACLCRLLCARQPLEPRLNSPPLPPTSDFCATTEARRSHTCPPSHHSSTLQEKRETFVRPQTSTSINPNTPTADHAIATATATANEIEESPQTTNPQKHRIEVAHSRNHTRPTSPQPPDYPVTFTRTA